MNLHPANTRAPAGTERKEPKQRPQLVRAVAANGVDVGDEAADVHLLQQPFGKRQAVDPGVLPQPDKRDPLPRARFRQFASQACKVYLHEQPLRISRKSEQVHGRLNTQTERFFRPPTGTSGACASVDAVDLLVPNLAAQVG